MKIKSTIVGSRFLWVAAALYGSMFLWPASLMAEHPSAPVKQDKLLNLTVTVTESDGSTPVVGAVVLLSGSTSKAAVTNLSGIAVLNGIPGSGTVEVSALGYTTRIVEVAGRTALDVSMEMSAINMGDVVVVGYGVQKKENVTGSVSMVSMEKALGNRPVTSVGAALQSTMPGLVVTGSAVPGSEMQFNIRGTTSLNGGAPLVLIDNVPGDPNMLNPQDIESVSVLKDAASSAIYGARGAFGVILITTKKAGKDKFHLNYNNSFAFSKAINLPQQASLRNFLQTHKEFDSDGTYVSGQNLNEWIGYLDQYEKGTLMQDNPGAYFKNGRFVPAGGNVYYYLTENNPMTEMIDKFGFMHMHNISASGGTEKLNYRLSLGTVNENGILITDKDKMARINVGAYISSQITPWLNTSLDVRYSKRERDYINKNDNIFKPVRSSYPTGTMPNSGDLDGPEYPTDTPANYVRYSEPTHYLNANPRIYSRTSITPFKGFEGVFEYTFDETVSDIKDYDKGFDMINDQMGIISSVGTPTYTNTKSTSRYNAINVYGTYNISTFDNNHNFRIMAGFAQESRYYEQLWASRQDMINPEMPSINGGTGTIYAGDDFTEFAIRSGFFRVNYDYKGKYLLEVNGRYDGSSRFPKKSRFGFFPSFSAGWQLGRETFMEWSRDWLDELKIRGSWGQLGNQEILDYTFLPTMESYLGEWVTGDDSRPTTLKPPGLVRSNFTWEKVEVLDIGFDMSLFRNRLTATFDWYRRDTKGMLAPGFELPGIVGADAPDQNVADLRNKGWELSLNWRENRGDWNYGIGFNLFDSRTRITKYDNAAGLLGDNKNGVERTDMTKNKYYEGMYLGEIWGYVTDGFYTIDDFKDGWQNGAWVLKDDVPGINLDGTLVSVRPGDQRFKNLRDNADGTVEINSGENTLANPGDQKIIGNSTPRYQYGANANVGWKGLDLSIFINGTGKRDYWLNGALIFPMNNGQFGTIYTHQMDYWKPADRASGDYTPLNPDAKYFRIYGEPDNNVKSSNTRVQTKYLSNAAYLRIKNVTLSYTIPYKIVSKIGLSNAKVFFSAENIYTWSKLPKGFDPERLSWGYPFFATYSFGINITL